MKVRKQLKQLGEWTLAEVRFISMSGQVLSTSYEVRGPKLEFADLATAEDVFHEAVRDLSPASAHA